MSRPTQDGNPGAGQHVLSAITPMSSFSQTQFPSPLFETDSGSKPSNRQSRPVPTPTEPHPLPQATSRRDLTETHGSMQPPSNVSTQTNQSVGVNFSPGSYRPSDRSLPSRDVTADNITDAFVSFIMYCNPHFPLKFTDTSMLRTNFETVPKTDQKEFQVFRLFELIKQLDAKELKTWAQLALALGVEEPDQSKGQSIQKIPQYIVRVKRWMKAMHIDSFFEYLLGKQNAYFTDIPSPTRPYREEGRVGVLTEDDLAVRALDPAWRPKRGRRRNSETELNDDAEAADTKKPLASNRSHMSRNEPVSAVPQSAHPDAYQDPWAVASAVTPQSFAPWANTHHVPQSAVAAMAPSHLRWQLHEGEQGSSTPHPMTAHPTSMSAHIHEAFDNEPKSAVTPMRKRRKHGPAVSSAWPLANTPGSRLRGRPPAGRTSQEGPFSTFPARPTESPADTTDSTRRESPAGVEDKTRVFGSADPAARASESAGRPGRLSLQVPHLPGGPVRLATPPRVYVNGESNDNDPRSETQTPVYETGASSNQYHPNSQVVQAQAASQESPSFQFESLKRALTTDLLRADLNGRHLRLTGDEAKRLADSILDRLGVKRTTHSSPSDDIARLTAASWLGLGERLGVPFGPATGSNKRLTATRFRVGDDGYEELVSAHEEPSPSIREIYDLSWSVSLNACNGTFELKGLSLAPAIPIGEREEGNTDTHDQMLHKFLDVAKQVWHREPPRSMWNNDFESIRAQARRSDDSVDWKARALALEFGNKMAQGEMLRFREMVIRKLLDIVQ